MPFHSIACSAVLMEGNTHAQWVLSELNQQRVLGKFCDVVLSSQSGQTLLAHRNVLACFSQIFSEPASSSTPCMELKLPPECPVDGVELLLQFFYTGELWLDGESEAKVRCAASDLSVPASLIPRQNLLEIKVVDCGGDVEGKPLLFTDTKPDISANGSYVLESKVETPGSEVAELDGESPSTSTTTRSGRRVRGPSRLAGERSQLVDPNQKAARRRAPAVETITDSGGEESRTQETHEPEPGPFDDDEDSTAADNVTDDTDEEYMPLESPSKGTRSKRQRTINVTDKENGEGSPTDAKKGCVQCPTCHKTFLSKYYLKVHNRRHTGEKPFECSKCGKCYYRKENLHGHEARNCLSRSAMVFSCPSCPMTFKRRQQLSLHMVTHTGDMPNKCTTCSEQFMHKKELRSHMIKIHGAPKPHACPQCPKCFLSRTELRLHEAAKHRGEKLFVCEECGHRASSRNGLQMHIKSIHRKERPFVCEFCNHAFTQKANLNMHLRTHTGEKPFQCHLCGKTFRTQASLDKHNRTHTGERPFSCEFCEQRFTEKGPLLRHVASKHQVGQPQFCPICNKSFKAVEQLRVHVRRHKGMRKFECTECGYKFTRQAHLRRHLQIHNRVENYNPRQRKLRNLVVEDEKADETPASLSGQRDTAETEQGVQPAPDMEQAPVELTAEDMEEQAPDMEQAPVVEPEEDMEEPAPDVEQAPVELTAEDMEEQAPDTEQAPVVEPEEDMEEPAPDMETAVDVEQASVVETIDVEQAPDVETAVDMEQAPVVKPVLDLEVQPADGEDVEHQADFSGTKEEPENFTMEDMMEHTVLVTDTFPIQSDLVVELQGSGADGTS